MTMIEPATIERTPDPTRRRAARLAGVGYVLLFALAIFANFLVFESLVVPDDGTATVANIAESQSLFRGGIAAFLLVFLIDVVVAWALHVVFRETDRDLSLLAAWFRLVYTVFLGAGLVFALDAVHLVGDGAMDAGLREIQVMDALGRFDDAWMIGLAAFGIHLVLVGALALRTAGVPRVLGPILVVAGLAYVLDTVAHTVVADYESIASVMLAIVAVPSMVGEGWLGLWLLRTRSL